MMMKRLLFHRRQWVPPTPSHLNRPPKPGFLWSSSSFAWTGAGVGLFPPMQVEHRICALSSTVCNIPSGQYHAATSDGGSCNVGASADGGRSGYNISLNFTAAEKCLINILAKTASVYNDRCGRSNKAHNNDIVHVRIAGGWVRDKILGRASDDIDVALEGLSGVEFAELVQSHLLDPDSVNSSMPIPLSRGGDGGQLVSSIGIVQKNAEQSKHLECATMRIGEHSIDFVNLRKEDYSSTGSGSRIPSFQEMGTPAEDAERRDFTINALFYNIHSQKIEDFNDGKGMDDLEALVLRTPQTPLQTLLDDPLRAVRAVRFLSTLHFPSTFDGISSTNDHRSQHGHVKSWKLDEHLAEALGYDAVAKALEQKVSRERIGIEMRKLMNGHRCFHGLDALRAAGQRTIVAIFNIPELDLAATKKLAKYTDVEHRLHSFFIDQARWNHTMASLEATVSQAFLSNMLEGNNVEKWELTTAILLSPLLRYNLTSGKGMTSIGTDVDNESRFASYIYMQYRETAKFDAIGRDISTYIISQSWKMPNRSAKTVGALLAQSYAAPWRCQLIDLVAVHLKEHASLTGEEIMELAKEWSASYVRDTRNHIPLGLWMKKSGIQNWKAALFLTVVSACQEAIAVRSDSESCMIAKGYKCPEVLSAFIGPLYLAFSRNIDAHPMLCPSRICSLKPVINGKEVQDLLDNTACPPSSCQNIMHSKKYIGEALKAMLAWQIQNPSAGQSEAEEFISQTWWPQFQNMHVSGTDNVYNSR